MSRRKAGCAPRRVDPARSASSDDETEMRDLVIDVKPEPNTWPLQAPGLQPYSSKEVPAPGRFEGETRYSPGLVLAGGSLHALGSRNQWTPWTSLIADPHGKVPLYRAPLPSPFTLRCDALLRAPLHVPCPLPPAPAIFP